FPTAVRVVDGVHRAAALVRLAAEPAGTAGLAEDDVLVVGVADRADRGVALAVETAQLARGHPDGDVRAVAALDLDAGARGARQLGALARHHLDGVDDRAHRDEAQRHGVAHLGLRLGAADDGAAHVQLVGGEDVALLAVGVVEQGDAGAAVRVVLDRGDLGGHAFLVATTEVDDAVATLVAAATEARGDAPVVVAAARLLQRAHERLLDRKSTRLNSSHVKISYAVFCLKKKRR